MDHGDSGTRRVYEQAEVDEIVANAVLAAKQETWVHVFQGIEEPCGCEPHKKLFVMIVERVREAVLAESEACLEILNQAVERGGLRRFLEARVADYRAAADPKG